MRLKLSIAVISTIILLLLLVANAAGCSAPDSGKIKIVTSTSLLAGILQNIGGSHVAVVTLIPGTQHPGDFSVRPGDIEKLSQAKVLFLHGWPGEGFADKMIAAADNPGLVVVKMNVDGNWMIPSIQAAATGKVADELSKIDPANAADYKSAADKYIKVVSAIEKALKDKLAKGNAGSVNAVSSAMQADFLKWAGINVAATYGDPRSLNPQLTKDLVDKGRAAKAGLVVDNLQNGKDAGRAIAEELHAKQINLSNFPGGFDDTETWEKAVTYNITLILNAIGK
jgi:zinc transport system substrate-binding protein